jgi:hypothetical protein
MFLFWIWITFLVLYKVLCEDIKGTSFLIQLVHINIGDSKNSMGLLMGDCALVILSSLLLYDTDHFTLGLLYDGSLYVE